MAVAEGATMKREKIIRYIVYRGKPSTVKITHTFYQ